MAPRKAAAKPRAEKPAAVLADPIETVAEPVADEGEAEDLDVVQALAEDAEPQPVPDEISAKVPGLTHEGEIARIDIWLSESRYLISQLEHDHVGPRGEIIAYLKARL